MPNVDTSKKFDSVEKYRIRKLLSELADKTGRGTELVSLYLPQKKAVHEAIAALREESGTASNIKSDVTRNHVQDALTKTMARLRLYKTTPENGIVIFCGAIPGPGGPGNETIELFEVLPQKPVSTYLYRCLAPETLVLLEDKSQIMISQLGQYPSPNVASFDLKTKTLETARIERHIDTVAGSRKVYRLTVESGRSIIATEDHPFFTPRGWVTISKLGVGDLTCVMPVSEDTSQQDTPDLVIVDENDIRDIEFPPANVEITIQRLKERGLLPLLSSNPKLPLLSRLLGRLFSEGSFTHDTELKKGKPYSHFTINFCLGEEIDYLELKSDIAKLGEKLPSAFRFRHIISKDGRSCETISLHAKMRDTALCTLLRALGAPIGSKVRSSPSIPKWLFNSPIIVQRDFLAAYLGGDGDVPSILKSNQSSVLRLVFHRIEAMKDAGLAFAHDLEQLFGNFGVIVNDIHCRPVYLGKDGLSTLETEIRFKLSQLNILKICHSIGYTYCKKKAADARALGEYLRVRRFIHQECKKNMKVAREMSSKGATLIQISGVPRPFHTTARQWSTGKITSPIIRSSVLPEFHEWLNFATQNLTEGLLWESIVSIEEVKQDRVMDLTIGNESHSFFANGFLVHNCDDHFHIEPLRDMLREQNVIGVLSMDSTEAGLGIVAGDSWEVIDTMSSGVSGKTRKGGQCVSSDTLVQLNDGTLTQISNISARSKIASYSFSNYESDFHECADTFSLVPELYYEISTKKPQFLIRSTSEHRFYTLDANGVSTKQAFELKMGDIVLVSRKLPSVTEPDLRTRFPADFEYSIDDTGRELLRQTRIQRKITQTCIANALGLNRTEISQAERGERTIVWEKLQKIINLLAEEPDEFVAKHLTTRRILPEFFTPELLQLLGYIAGDDTIAEKNRIAMWEKKRGVAELYTGLARKSLRLDYIPIMIKGRRESPKTRSRTICYETRIYSLAFVKALRKYYSGLVAVGQREVPEQIHRLDNVHLAYFLKGMFDAGGHVQSTRLGIAMKSGRLIRQVQLLLLRFGIVSSYSCNVNKFGTKMHRLDVCDLDSIITFNREIGFSAEDNKKTLEFASRRKCGKSYLDAPVIGSWVDKRARQLRIRREQFKGITNFFHDRRGISSEVFQRVAETFQREMKVASQYGMSNQQVLFQETTKMLSMIAKSELTLAYVSMVKIKENKVKDRFIDIELPETKSFIGNGFVLHNSARRYERLREMELTDYFNRLADHAKKAFLEQYQIKGLIVSGPGPTKDEFVRDRYLDYRLQNVIVGTLDSGYSGREGVRETIEKAGKLLENVRVIEEKKLVQRFFREVNSDSGLGIYGVKDILTALKRAAVDTIIINDDVDTVYLKTSCNKCGNITEKFVSRSQIVSEKQRLLICPKCGSNEVNISEKDVVEFLADAAIDSGANVEVISSKTEDGAMMKNFGGISAILRYKA